jgi:hypothetical protein
MGRIVVLRASTQLNQHREARQIRLRVELWYKKRFVFYTDTSKRTSDFFLWR